MEGKGREGRGEGTRNILTVILRQWMYGDARKQDKDEGGEGVRKESSFQRQDMGIESV